MENINKAMKKLQESKRISLKEANETATFELDWANEDIANMENDQEKELTLIKNVENTLKTNKIGAKVEVVSIDGVDFGGWPVVKVTGPKEELARSISINYMGNEEDEVDLNDVYDTYLESKELKESRDRVAENIGKFIYDLGDSAWSYSGESKNNNGQKLYTVNKNGKETIDHNELTKKVLEKFPELVVMLDTHNTIVFTRKDQLNKIEKESLTESEDEFEAAKYKGNEWGIFAKKSRSWVAFGTEKEMKDRAKRLNNHKEEKMITEDEEEDNKRKAYYERTKKRLKEYQDSIDMEPLFNWLREVTNIPELKFKVEKEDSRGEYYINFESQNVVEKTGIMKLALSEVRIDSFANGVTTTAPSYYSDKKIDYDKDYELYYWVQCHFSFELKEGGSNGVKFGTATCKEGKWDFKLTETIKF